MGASDVIDRLWADVTSPVPPEPLAAMLALAAVGASLLVPTLWHTVRHIITVAHEGGHAAVAAVMGRKVRGIRLHSDTSGVTVSSGDTRRLPIALKAFAGYPAPAVLGLGAAALIAAGHAIALLWIVVLVLVVVLIRVRNAYGLLVMVLAIAAFVAAAWSLPDPWRVGLAYGVAWLLLLGAMRAVVELQASRRVGRGRGSDADVLARLTHVPGVPWVGLFWLVTAACAVLGGWWLLAPVAEAWF